MCLNHSKIGTQKVRKKLGRKGYCYFYKVVLENYDQGPRFFSQYKKARIDYGWYKSDRKTYDDHCLAVWVKKGYSASIYNGIHVYTNLEKAKQKLMWANGGKIVKVKCHKKDFVCASSEHVNEAVFHKVFVLKEKVK